MSPETDPPSDAPREDSETEPTPDAPREPEDEVRGDAMDASASDAPPVSEEAATPEAGAEPAQEPEEEKASLARSSIAANGPAT